MALKYCSHCGKQVTDRMSRCPHCNVVLQTPQLKQVSAKSGLKENLLAAAVALALTTIIVLLWRLLASVCMFRFLGTAAGAALDAAARLFYGRCYWLLPVGAALFGLIPVLLPRKPGWQALTAMILTAVLALSGYLMYQVSFLWGLRQSDFAPETVGYARTFALMFGAGFPVVLGSFCVAGFERRMIKALPVQGILAGGFLLLAWLLGMLMVIVFGMGPGGFGLGGTLAALLMFAAAALTGAGCIHRQ